MACAPAAWPTAAPCRWRSACRPGAPAAGGRLRGRARGAQADRPAPRQGRVVEHFNFKRSIFTLARRASGDCLYLDAQTRRCTKMNSVPTPAASTPGGGRGSGLLRPTRRPAAGKRAHLAAVVVARRASALPMWRAGLVAAYQPPCRTHGAPRSLCQSSCNQQTTTLAGRRFQPVPIKPKESKNETTAALPFALAGLLAFTAAGCAVTREQSTVGQ